MTNVHRPEVGNTEGVKEWSEGKPYCTIVCTNGHKKRTIERVRWAGENEKARHIYTGQVRILDIWAEEIGTTAEENDLNPSSLL